VKRLLFVLALAGCSTAPPRVGESPPQVTDPQAEAQYHDVFDRWTRHAEIYDLLNTRMFVAATEQSPEFVKARVDRMSQFKGLSTGEAQALTATELGDASKSYEFFIGVHTPDRKVNDLDRPSSIWHVALASQAGEVTPIDVERVSRPDANLRGIYFYLADFWVGYVVRFPAVLADGRPLVAPGDANVSLRIDSALGHARMEFPAQALAIASVPVPPSVNAR
jgi:hypothetical protein